MKIMAKILLTLGLMGVLSSPLWAMLGENDKEKWVVQKGLTLRLSPTQEPREPAQAQGLKSFRSPFSILHSQQLWGILLDFDHGHPARNLLERLVTTDDPKPGDICYTDVVLDYVNDDNSVASALTEVSRLPTDLDKFDIAGAGWSDSVVKVYSQLRTVHHLEFRHGNVRLTPQPEPLKLSAKVLDARGNKFIGGEFFSLFQFPIPEINLAGNTFRQMPFGDIFCANGTRYLNVSGIVGDWRDAGMGCRPLELEFGRDTLENTESQSLEEFYAHNQHPNFSSSFYMGRILWKSKRLCCFSMDAPNLGECRYPDGTTEFFWDAFERRSNAQAQPKDMFNLNLLQIPLSLRVLVLNGAHLTSDQVRKLEARICRGLL